LKWRKDVGRKSVTKDRRQPKESDWTRSHKPTKICDVSKKEGRSWYSFNVSEPSDRFVSE
jgi:hypothetical protein